MTSARGKRPNASITNVAALADVSIATVSRVLSGRRTKDDDIARRVRQAAIELDYAVNSAASALRSDTSNIIALSLPATPNPLHAGIVAAISDAASAAGRQLLVGTDSTPTGQHQRIKAFIRHNADGIIVLPCPRSGTSTARGLATADTPIIQLFGSTNLLRHDWISIDNGASIELAVTHVVERGAHSIAYFSDAVGSSEGAQTLLAFQSSLNMLHAHADSDWITIADGTTQRGFADTMRIFGDASREIPEAIICASVDTAIGAMIALSQLAIDVPNRVQIVSLRDDTAAATSVPSLTAMRAPLPQMAAESLRLIANAGAATSDAMTVARLRRHVAFPRRVVARGSTRHAAVA